MSFTFLKYLLSTISNSGNLSDTLNKNSQYLLPCATHFVSMTFNPFFIISSVDPAMIAPSKKHIFLLTFGSPHASSHSSVLILNTSALSSTYVTVGMEDLML